MNKEHKDPDVIDLDAPRLAWYMQKVWKKHQNTVEEQPSGSSAQEIDKRVLLGCESTNERTARLVSSCVPVSVKL